MSRWNAIASLYSFPMRELLLAMLARKRAYGYELRQSLEREFGDALPAINAGQMRVVDIKPLLGRVPWGLADNARPA